MITAVKRGDIFYADLSPVVGSEQGGMRPVLVIQNDVGNKYSPTVIAAAITSRMGKTKLPTHIDIYAERVGLARDSVVLLEQVRTLDKRRLKEKMGHLDDEMMQQIDTAIAVSLGLLPHGARLPAREDTRRHRISVSIPREGEKVAAAAAAVSPAAQMAPAAAALSASDGEGAAHLPQSEG